VGLAACHSSTGLGTGVHRAALIALVRLDSAEPFTPVTFTFHNNQIVNFTVVNSDSASTTFATFHFTPQSVAYRNDTLLADTSTVSVQVTVTPGVFGFTVGPTNLFFNTTNSPTVDVSYVRYADLNATGWSVKYSSAPAYTQALGLWFEFGSDQWRAQNSGSGGLSVLSSALAQPGLYLLAAPK
jgi:hypothetical protein